MPRNLRIKSLTGIYHVMVRGVNKRIIFFENEDRKKFLQLISYYRTKYDTEIYGYCLMDNHVHLLLKNEKKLDKFMQCLQTVYALYFNKKYKRIGHLFQDRYKSIVVEKEKYILECLKYIHQNPVKANIASVDKYKWSSYNEFIECRKIVNTKYILDLFSKDEKVAISIYEKYMKTINKKVDFRNAIIEDKLDDDEAIEFIENFYNINIQEIKNYDKIERNVLLSKIISNTVFSIRQISRITGIDRNVLRRL